MRKVVVFMRIMNEATKRRSEDMAILKNIEPGVEQLPDIIQDPEFSVFPDMFWEGC